jgi:malic enzyme
MLRRCLRDTSSAYNREDRQHARPIETARQQARLRRVAQPIVEQGFGVHAAERTKLGLEGILPPQFNDMAMQAQRSYEGIQRHAEPIDKYVALAALQDRNEHLFYRVVRDHIEEFMPIIYTPTVGQATRDFSHVFQHSRGVWITPSRGHIATALRNAAGERRIRLMVVTDNESILGIGDQGAGIGIRSASCRCTPRRRRAHRRRRCRSACRHRQQALLDDRCIWGVGIRACAAPRRRADRRVRAGREGQFPGAVLQWEDSARKTLTIMNKYRKVLPSFNDDIQHRCGGVGIAGRVASSATSSATNASSCSAPAAASVSRARSAPVCCNTGSTTRRSRTHRRARQPRTDRQRQRDARCAQERTRLVAGTASRVGLGNAAQRSLTDVVDHFKPTVVIGASGQPGISRSADPPRCRSRRAADHLPLSNPNDNTEARPEDIDGPTGAHRGGRSPFQPVAYGGELRKIGQASNVHLSGSRARRLLAMREADRQHDQRRRRIAPDV